MKKTYKDFQAYVHKATAGERLSIIWSAIVGNPINFNVSREEKVKLIEKWSKELEK